MRVHSFLFVLLPLAATAPASAQSAPLGFGRQAAADPDAGVERLAAAMSRQSAGGGHDRPERRRYHSIRDVMKDGSTRDAYAWLDNK